LSQEIGQVYPGCTVRIYAAMQVIQAESIRALSKPNADANQVQTQLRDRLLRFAQEHPGVPEAAKAILEAGQISESLKKVDDARRCYRYLSEHYPDNPLARKARGAMWRLGMAGEPVAFSLPYLYPTSSIPDQKLDSAELGGKLVVVYFWASTGSHVSEDFQTLKRLTDRYRDHGLEVVYVNLDKEPAAAHAFLSGRLLAGTHVYDRGGLDSPIADRYGIQSLPQAMLVDREGKLLKHSLQVSQLEEALSAQFPHGR
jgi:thiol-disulfide isomerase/thioredoxin